MINGVLVLLQYETEIGHGQGPEEHYNGLPLFLSRSSLSLCISSFSSRIRS